MKQLKNNKGMSLVEVVMAILIISLASVLLVQSLSTVTTVISKADRRSHVTNEQLSALVGSQDSERVTIVEQDKEVVITAEGLTSPIKIDGTYQEASSNENEEVKLRTFTAIEKREDMYQKMLSNSKKVYDETWELTAAEKLIYLKQLEEKAGITTGMTPATGIRNDELRVYYYLKYGFPPVKQEIIDECNKIFDQTHPNASPTSNEGKEKIGNRQMFWKVYYLDKSVNKGDAILYGVYTNNINQDGWKTSLVYNAADGNVYYKIFPVPSESWNTSGSSIVLTEYGNSLTGLLRLQNELTDTTKWKKLRNK